MADADHARSWCQELGRPSVNEIAALSIIVDLDLLPSRQPPNDINAILKSVAERFVMQGFWITAFSPDSSKQAQASAFWPLIKANKREIETKFSNTWASVTSTKLGLSKSLSARQTCDLELVQTYLLN